MRREQLMQRVEKGTNCWLWTGARDQLGYGQAVVEGRRMGAHRAVYELLVGPIADGLVIDHLCRKPSCVNPSHLEAVTQSENLKRGLGPAVTRARHAAQTHCRHGHEFSPDNTIVNSSGSRVCRTCNRVRALAHYYRKRSAA